MTSSNTPVPEPWTTRILSDSEHFSLTSQVGRDRPDLTTAKHSISLDLEDATIKNAIKAVVTKDIQRAVDATAEDATIAEYLSRLGITIPQGDRGDSAQQFTPVRDPSEVKENHQVENSVIPDRLLRMSNASLSAGDGGKFPMGCASLISKLIGVTRACLNAQLYDRWNAEAELDRSELRNMVLPDGGNSARSSLPAGVFIDAQLAAPHISLLVESGGTETSALFYLNFLEGRCALWDEEAGALCEIASTFGWRIASKVKLRLFPLYMMSFECRCLVSLWGLPPNYDISALIVSFNEVTIDIPSSIFPTPLSESVHASLADLITAHLRRRSVTINYAVTSPSSSLATVHDPTVAPTALRLQTYPHKRSFFSESGIISASDPDNSNPLNTLLYLPSGASNPESQLPWSVNWVPSEINEDSDISGALVLGREAFIENFLLPKLAGLNKATYFEMKVAETKKTGAFQAEYGFAVGKEHELGDEEFAWTAIDAASTGKGVLRYIWSRTSAISDRAGGHGFGSKVRGTAHVRNVLTIRGRTNRIGWEAEAQVKFETELETFGVTNKGVSTVWRKGTTDLVIEEVDGKLGLRIEMPNGWIETGSTSGNTSFGLRGEEIEKLGDELESKYLNVDQIKAVVNDVNARLTRNWTWVYPTFGQSFSMKDPVLSDELDLLVDLAFTPVQTEEF